MNGAHILGSAVKKIGALIGVLGVAAVGLYLFFGDQILFSLHQSAVQTERPSARGENEVLSIAYAFSPVSLDPTLFDPLTRSYLVDIYEGLVKTDENLKIIPGLAVSWGRTDDYTWEFRLRPGITFHDGRAVTASDVVASLDYALNGKNSQLKTLLNTIRSVDVSADDTVKITTSIPDPLLLTKLAVTYVFPRGTTDFSRPVGTGPYKFVSMANDVMSLERYDGYWGEKPAFKTVHLVKISDRRDRIKALEDGQVQLLTAVPPNIACSFSEEYRSAEGCSSMDITNLEVKTIPSLEVDFLVLNFKSDFFRNVDSRAAVKNLLDHQVFVDLAYGFAHPVHQLVSSGVFGFNPEIEDEPYNLNIAKELMKDSISTTFERTSVTFDYPEALQSIGEYVQEQFRAIGVDLELNPLSDQELQEKILNGTSDFYYLGWRSELGDASDFLQAVAHSRDLKRGYGQFNGGSYMNKEVDKLIEESQMNLDESSRLKQMQQAMKILVDDDIFAVPLFETETIFAASRDIQFSPRVDGYVYASYIR